MTNVVDIVVTAGAALVGGATGGAFVSGYFAIRQKALARVQKRRSGVYVEMLGWIGARTAFLAAPPGGPGGGPGGLAGAAGPGAGQAQVPVQQPGGDNAALQAAYAGADPDLAKTDPGQRYFLALRARIAAFGSHDMTRAFDRWVDAYLVAKESANGEGATAARLKIVVTPDANADRRRGFAFLRSLPHYLVQSRDAGRPDKRPGCLTRAVEYCASTELRKG